MHCELVDKPFCENQSDDCSLLNNTKKVEHFTDSLQLLNTIIDLKILLLVYKALNKLGLKYISDLVWYHEPSRSLRSSGKGLLSVLRINMRKQHLVFIYHISGTNSQKTAGLLPLLFISGDKFLYLQWFGVEERGRAVKKVVDIASLF